MLGVYSGGFTHTDLRHMVWMDGCYHNGSKAEIILRISIIDIIDSPLRGIVVDDHSITPNDLIQPGDEEAKKTALRTFSLSPRFTRM